MTNTGGQRVDHCGRIVHTITVTHTDSATKYGRPKRQHHAVCTCGWVDNWAPISKAAAVEHGQNHTSSVTP
jgi:hypothetical protein